MASNDLFLSVLLFIFLFPQIHSISFKINDFNSNSNMLYHGDAKPENGSIGFNGQLGWAIYSQKLILYDHSKAHLSNFNTNFTFLTKSSTHSHGLTFFLTPSEFNPNSFLSLFNSSQKEPFQSPIIHVWISYNATAKNLSVSLNNNATISQQIDLVKILPKKVTVGFSASTANLSVEFWEFNSSKFDDIQTDESEKDINMKLITVLISWMGVFVIGIVLIFVVSVARREHQKQNGRMKLASIYSDLNREASAARRFSYRYLEMATDNYSMNGKLGEGRFGTVFKGNLPGVNKTVAVKKIFKNSMERKREYVSEVNIIAHLRHRNLVQLIGWCHEREDLELLLVYEFMPNGSLHSHLFGKKTPLSWPLRYKISIGLASALLYLHEECEHSVIHRDIKPSNVLLDSNFTAKLGDFGLARLAKHELSSKTSALVGTFGYMAPEYISSGRASKESDIFSYGVVLLEIVSGRKCCDHSGKGLVELVWDAYGRGEIVDTILDEKLRQGFVEAREVERLSVVGLWCAHPHATQRPSIKQVIQVLSFEEPLPNLPQKMPLPTFNHAFLRFYNLNFPLADINFELT